MPQNPVIPAARAMPAAREAATLTSSTPDHGPVFVDVTNYEDFEVQLTTKPTWRRPSYR
ncbi:hypothetical protein [Nigerium massiliense]|uniref:hypothetical protein n=1 Tax=Nigerium massiliense TaxID=1522317 RepID=UPI0012FE631F|nr:hypothetical protein [Nigerium massiliense]